MNMSVVPRDSNFCFDGSGGFIFVLWDLSCCDEN